MVSCSFKCRRRKLWGRLVYDGEPVLFDDLIFIRHGLGYPFIPDWM